MIIFQFHNMSAEFKYKQKTRKKKAVKNMTNQKQCVKL